MDKQKLISILQSNDKSSLERFLIEEPVFEFLFTDGLEFFGSKYNFYKNEPQSMKVIVGHFLQYAEDHGAVKTAKNIEKYLNTDKLDGLIVLAICGISLDIPIVITDHIKLIPYQNVADSFYKAIFDPYSINSDISSPSFPKEFLAMRENPISKSFDNVKIKPTAALVYSVSGTRKQPVENFEKIYHDLKNICLSLTLVGPSAPTPLAMWWQTENWVNCWPGSEGSVCAEEFDLINRSNKLLNSAEVNDEIIRVCNAFLTLNKTQQEKLYIPLSRLNNAMIRKNYKDKAIELGIAIESTFLNDKSSTSELTYRVQLRATKLLGEHVSLFEKKAICDLFKLLYGYRSKVVHGDVLNDSDDVRKHIEEGISKTAQAIKIILLQANSEREWKDFWEELVLA